MSLLDTLVSFQLTLLLHATVLLGLAWSAERAGLLRHPGWAELAWRGALFGALLSATLSVLAPAAGKALAPPSADRAELAASATVAGRASDTAAAIASANEAAAPSPDPSATASINAAAGATAAPTERAPLRPVTAKSLVERLSTTPAAELNLPDVAVVALLLPWALGLLFVALRLANQWRQLRRWTRTLASREMRPAAPLAAMTQGLAREMVLPRTPSLHVVAGLPSPLLLPGARLLLPEWVDTLGRPQQRALLAHELAHVQRRDPTWRLAQRIALLPLFLHPLAWRALRRLEALAEDACDARAAELCGSGRPLAECLATCLIHADSRVGHSPLATAMAEDSGQVVRRVQNLLEEAPMPRPIPTFLRRTALVVALAAVVTLPGLAVTSFGNDAFAGDFFGWGSGTSHTESDGRNSYRYWSSNTGEKINLVMKGRVEFNAGESDIVAMDPDAEFELSDKRKGVTRELAVSAVGGKLVRDYRVDGEVAPFDASARAWLAERLPHLMRETGMDAEARGQRILAKGGAPALLDEIGQIRGEYARRRYLEVLFANAKLDDEQMRHALRTARGLDSDYETRLALSAGLASQSLSPSRLAQLLEVVASMGSDYEKTELLRALATRQPPIGEVLPAWRLALDSIGSDYERRRVLGALLARNEPVSGRIALESAREIGSDYEARQVLVAAIPQVRTEAGVRQAWFTVLAGVGSDYEQRQALEALISAGPVDVALAGEVLDSIADIGSGHEAAATLRELAAAMPADPALIERYRAAARRLSDHERGQAEKALDRFASR